MGKTRKLESKGSNSVADSTCQCGRHGFAPGQEGRSEQETASHASILAGTNPWTEEPGRLQPMGSHSQTTEHTAAFYGLALLENNFTKEKSVVHFLFIYSLTVASQELFSKIPFPSPASMQLYPKPSQPQSLFQ